MALRDVIGQDRAVNILLGTLRQGRVPSSYLFAGESGIGKKFTAINLAKALNCLKAVTTDELQVTSKNKDSSLVTLSLSKGHRSLVTDCCDECSSCKKIDAGTHPDLLMISPEKAEIRVAEIRAAEEALSFKPYEGKKKVVIVDDAEAMNPSAANAFLKTIEEPPPDSLIILISSSPDRLPETIRSRCSRINFLPLSPEKCKDVIKTVINQESGVRGQGSKKDSRLTARDSRLATIARLAMGRPGLAISADLIEERDWCIRLLQEMLRCDNKETWREREEIDRWFNISFTMLRDMATLKITGDENALINIDIKEDIVEMSKTMDLQVIIESYFKLALLKGYLGFNLNKSLTWNYTGSILRKLKK